MNARFAPSNLIKLGKGGNGGSGGIGGNGGIGGSGGIRGIRVSGGIGGSERVNRDGQPRLVPVTGARNIWGTVKYATAASVTSTLKTLAKLPVDAVFVKRKYKIAQNNRKQVVRWFVVRGERVLKDLEMNWGSVSIQTAWKLERVMEFEATMSPTPQKQHTIPSDQCLKFRLHVWCFFGHFRPLVEISVTIRPQVAE